MDWIRKYKYLLIAVFAVLLFSVFPHIYSVYLAGAEWKGILPEYTNDSWYYYARMNDVSKGNIFIGNPYYLEHRGEYAPAFFVADWLANGTQFLGLSLSQTVYLNSFLWSLLFFLSLLFLFKELGLPKSWMIIGSLMGYLSVYLLMIRPVIMQVIFPFFIFFLVALIRYLKESNKRKNLFILIFFYTLSFYLYSYFWQIAVVSIVLTNLWFVIQKKWTDSFSLAVVNILTFVLSLPVFWYTYLQIKSPFYWETMARIGLVETRLPTFSAIFDSIIVCLGLMLLLFAIKELKSNNIYNNKGINIFFIFTGLGLIITNLSNLITGKELEISIHIGRFITVWITILIIFLFYLLKSNYSSFFPQKKFKQYAYTILFVLLILMCFPRIKDLIYSPLKLALGIKTDNILEVQTLSKPFSWLEKNSVPNSVVWANKIVSANLPIYTHNYVLFSPLGGLHLMTNQEQKERYLVSNYFRNLTLEDIKNDFRSYAGAGNAIHQYKTNNRRVLLCKLFLLEKLRGTCGKIENGVSFQGEPYFSDLYLRYTREVKPNINDFLAKYQVSYFLIDKQQDKLKLSLANIAGLKAVYEDDRFQIYLIETRD